MPLKRACLFFSFFFLFSTAAYASVTIRVSILPNTGDVPTGAVWYLNNDPTPRTSGASVSGLSNNTTYTISFSTVNGWYKPANVSVSGKNETIPVTGAYSRYDKTLWPVWPKKAAVTGVWEPSSFLSVGRDVIAWVDFSALETNDQMYKADLFTFIRTGDTSFTKRTPNFAASGQSAYYVPADARKPIPSTYIDDFAGDLRTKAVLKEYKADWIPSGPYPNQNFNNGATWLDFSAWVDFLKGSEANFYLADSGHAPPFLMWNSDNWMTTFVDPFVGKSSVPSAWTNADGTSKVFLFLPTNQGMLNTFEVSGDTDPTVPRKWQYMPNPAFNQAIYHQVKQQEDGYYSRMTVLDGPISVHDVYVNNQWRRILVGTTGLGTQQENKPVAASIWNREGTTLPSGASPNTMPSPGRFFGLYALDVTNPLNPTPLWSVSRIAFTRDGETAVNQVSYDVQAGTEVTDSKYSGYSNLLYSVSRPLIGFTKNQDNTLEAHVVLVGINTANKYVWYDINATTGEIIATDTFKEGTTPESLPADRPYEDWYPSRILSAYPKEPALYNYLPLLSDVYVYLSNGTFFKWNLQTGTKVPQKLFTVYTNEGHAAPAPPITDFDISYVYVGDNLHTYLAATAPLEFPTGNPHDTYGLFIVDLDRITPIADLNTQGALGQTGDTVARVLENGVAFVQLQTRDYEAGGGSNAYDFDTIAASPLFINNILYQAIYTTEGDVSRLYTLDMTQFRMDWGHGSGGRNPPLPEDAFLDIENKEVAAMLIDSSGYLVLLDEEGNVIHRSESPVLDLGTGAGVGTGTEGFRVVYWKVRG